ncbi:UDP-N-acetylglucosamine 2-epimerase (non-hydrolyzing) [bacterium]|nr:UDP-N-acetylglucosamine 2-epimerase (non-hydrolyzing) [bacterium]
MKIVTVVGARPQFIKAAVVSRALADYNDNQSSQPRHVTEILVHTGQHFDDTMSRIFFQELGIPEPHYNLGINECSHGAMTGRMLENIEKVILDENPDIVLVYGDTNSTLAGALAAAKLNIPVAHVEAGLRSFNRTMPEEINRVLTDHISSLLFCPTERSVKNLQHEGIDSTMIHRTGDVMFDACLYFGLKAREKSRIITQLDLEPGQYLLATVHRAENTDNETRLRSIFNGLAVLAQEMPVVVPLHPRTANMLKKMDFFDEISTGLTIIEPVGYLDMVMLEQNARVIITDSGGVQKEAFFHRVPCIILRKETEWVELIESGWSVLVDTDVDRLISEAGRLINTDTIDTEHPDLYGDGHAGNRIVEIMSDFG